ncbi:MAG: hypothetical protein HYV63_33655, partial [Candidatus Schekmanbacteria bacterium]|nr:hypothetical protein [Candidatus Schekmanbacteria bacterium]
DKGAVIAGFFSETAVFGHGEPNETTLACSSGVYEDGFIARYGADGSLVWATAMGAASRSARVEGLAVDPAAQALVVAGDFDTLAVFGAGDPTETTLTGGGCCEIFVAKYALGAQTVPLELAAAALLAMPAAAAVYRRARRGRTADRKLLRSRCNRPQ